MRASIVNFAKRFIVHAVLCISGRWVFDEGLQTPNYAPVTYF